MKRHGQTCDESRNVSCDLARYNSIPNSFLSSFADLHDDGMSRMPRISNESSNLNVMLPAMFCAGTSHTVAASISNSLLQIEMDELRRPMMEDHKQFSVESGNRRLSGQNSRFHEEASPSFAATLKQHPSLAAADFKYEFATSHVHFNSHQQQNLQSSEEKVRSIAGKGIQSPMGKNGNGSMTTSEIMTNSPITIKSNLLRHRSSPASLFSDLTTDAAGIATRHTDQNGSQLSTQLVQSAENEDVVGYSEEAGLTSLSEAAELTVDIGGRGLDGDSISHEGSLMSILEGTSSIRKRARGLDGIQMNVSSPSDLQDGLAEHTTSLTRHMSLPVPLKPNDVPQGDNCLQDSVPCRLRAKRGCATHPRSIAERVRRTRISERMRKLQELVPNMDKQSNTADMLDEAVEYVKFLQRQVQELSQSRARCERLCQLKQNESQPS